MALASVSIQHSTQGEVRADVSIEHEECFRASSQDLVPKMVETTPCAQGGKFLKVPIPRDPKASSVISEKTYTKSQESSSPTPSSWEYSYPQRNSIYRESEVPK